MRSASRRLLSLLPALVGITLVALAIWSLRQELGQARPEEIWRSLTQIPAGALLAAVGLTGLNGLVFTGYDCLALRYIRHPLPYRKAALAAYTSTAISNSVGLSLLSSSAIRYRFYAAWGIPKADIAHLIAFCNLSFWLGLFAVAGLMFLLQPVAIPSLLHLPFESVRSLGGLFLGLILGYLLWNLLSTSALKIGSLEFPHLSTPLALAQVLVASLDWSFAATVLYLLLPPFSVNYSAFLSAYLLGQIAGILSNVPGGLGVFETVLLLLLESAVPKTALLGALLAYRAIYYLLPLSFALLLLGLYELRRHQWSN